MNKVSRMLTGGIIIVFSILLIVFYGLLGDQGIDYGNILVGFFFLLVGFLILFNKKEDEIEKIKSKK